MPDWKALLRERLLDSKIDVWRVDDVIEELSQCMEACFEEACREGMTEDEAVSQVLAELGPKEELVDRIKRSMTPDLVRSLKNLPRKHRSRISWPERGNNMLTEILFDLRYAIRMLRGRPGFALITILALALGIGANTAIFSIVNAALIRPLPFDHPEQLAWIWATNPEGTRLGFPHLPPSIPEQLAWIWATNPEGTRLGFPHLPPSIPDFIDWQKQNTVFDSLATVYYWNANFSGRSEPEELSGASVSANLLQLLHVKPILGRDFRPEDDQIGAGKVVLLGYGFWQTRFGSNPNIIGQALGLDGESYTVIGVMPPGFNFPKDTGLPTYYTFGTQVDVWKCAAFAARSLQDRSARSVAVISRLKPNVTVKQAQAEMSTISSRLEQQYPDTNKDWNVSVDLMQEQVVASTRAVLLILLGAVGFVLLIACANVANLLLARAAVRQKEISIRSALGASRSRIIRQLLTESMLLGVAGGALGIPLALLGIRLLIALSPGNIPRLAETTLDVRVLGFTLLISLLTGILFGLAPALQMSRPDLNETLKDSARGSTGTRHRLLSVLVVSELALAIVLLIGSGLLIKSFIRVQQVNPGFSPEHLLTMRVTLPATYDPERTVRFFRQAIERVKTIPTVETASVVNKIPLGGGEEGDFFVIEGRPAPVKGELLGCAYRVITADYFHTLQIPLLRGRYFTEQDTKEKSQEVIIDDLLAERFFAGENPIGKRIMPDNDKQWLTIVGIVGTVRHSSLDAAPFPHIYLPLILHPRRKMTLEIRSTGDPLVLVQSVKREINSLDKDQPISDIATMDGLFSKSVAPRRLNMFLLGIFAGIALLLAAIGIYGVISYSVTQRTHEIGIRMALGAKSSDILKLVVGNGMLLAVVGIAIGVIAALGLTALMSSLLYGVSPKDPGTFIGISLMITIIALLASYIPASKAMKVDPVIAIRNE